jgi:hypothetical protein
MKLSFLNRTLSEEQQYSHRMAVLWPVRARISKCCSGLGLKNISKAGKSHDVSVTRGSSTAIAHRVPGHPTSSFPTPARYQQDSRLLKLEISTMADDTTATPAKQCMGDGCPNDAGSLQCPTCLKLGLKDSFFCSQECFKKSWVSSQLLIRDITG